MNTYLKILFFLALLIPNLGNLTFANENNYDKKTDNIETTITLPANNTNNEKVEVSLEDFKKLVDTVKSLQNEVVTLKGRLEKYESISQVQKTNDFTTNEGDKLVFGDNFLQSQSSRIDDSIINLDKEDTNLFKNFQQMNPEISVQGDLNFTGSTRSFDPDRNKFNLREVEVAFESGVDPYSKANIILGVHKHNHHSVYDRLNHEEHETIHSEEEHGFSLDIEEAYLTLLSLPGGFQSKLGKFYNAFGLLNRVHQPELPQFDRPNVLSNFFGAEALSEIGINVSKVLPTPWFSQFELELTNGDNEIFFGNDSISRPLVNGYLCNAFDLPRDSILRLGLSGAFGSKAKQEFVGRYAGVEGVDLTFLWAPKGKNHSFRWQTEFLAAQLEHPQIEKSNFFGMYTFGEYQFSKRWAAGLRFDYSQVPLAPEVKEYALSPYINFYQSEFARLRFQYKHNFRNFGLSSDQFFVQYTFMLGSHKHDLM